MVDMLGMMKVEQLAVSWVGRKVALLVVMKALEKVGQMVGMMVAEMAVKLVGHSVVR